MPDRIVTFGGSSTIPLQETVSSPIDQNKTTEYSFDAGGNRIEKIDSILGTTTYIYDANDRLLSEALNGDVTEYTYDNNGNLISSIRNGLNESFYEWNAKGELAAIETTENGQIGRIEYQYDTDGIRVAINIDGEETHFLIDKNQQQFAQVIEEYLTTNNIVSSYVYGIDLILKNNTDGHIYYQVDGLGSTRITTNIDGDIIQEYDYDAYGNIAEKADSINNNYLFTGEQYDNNLDSYYLRARYYDSSVGRFISRDPFEGVNKHPITLHDYLYGNNNPVLFIDPSGNLSLIGKAIIIGGVSGAILAPTFDVICNATLNEFNEITISREIKKSIQGAAIGAALGGTIAFVGLSTTVSNTSTFNFIFQQLVKSQTLFKVPSAGIAILLGKIIVLKNCDFLEFIGVGF